MINFVIKRMAFLNGTAKRVKIGEDVIGKEFQSVLDLGMDLPKTTSKDDQGYESHIMGVRNGSLSVSCFADADETINFETITGYVITKANVSFAFEDLSYRIFGTGTVQNASEVAENENTTRYEIEIKLNGTISILAIGNNFLLLGTGDYYLQGNGDRFIINP